MRVPSRHRARRYLLALTLAFAALLCSASAASALAAELKVDTLEDRSGGSCDESTSCSLREAIAAVNAGQVSGAVTIAVEVNGTIGVGDKGALKIDPPAAVSSLTILGPTGEASGVTISGEEKSRILELVSGEVEIADVTLTKGHVTALALDGDGGGAILQEGGQLTLRGVRLTENHIGSVRNGGAIAIEGGSATVADSLIDKNTTAGPAAGQGNGGGIYLDSELGGLILEDTDVIGNEAIESGGGIHQYEGSLVIDGGRIAENRSEEDGGGIVAEADGGHVTTVTGVEIVENHARSAAGGMSSENGSGGVTIEKTAIERNVSELRGAGLFVNGPTTVLNSTVARNEDKPRAKEEEEGRGAGIDVFDDKLTLEGSTVAMNGGVGLFVDGGAEAVVHASTIAANTTTEKEAGGVIGWGDVVISSSIVAYNVADGESVDCASDVTSEGHNVIGKLTSACAWVSGTGDQLNVLPSLGSLQDNGGPTETMAPTTFTSVAINHGADPASSDQRGLTRPVPDDPALTDVGAVEVQAPVNSVPPSIEPSAGILPGTELHCNDGTWDPDTIEDPQTRYTWFVEGEEVSTVSAYTTAEADAGKEIACEVGVNNGAAVTEAISDPVHFGPPLASLAPATLEFGQREVDSGGMPSELFLFLKNNGGEDLTVTGIASSDADQFPLDLSDCGDGSIVLASGESCEVRVEFEPTANGPQASTISVQSDGGSASAEAKGIGLAPVLTITPGSHDFGELPVPGPGPWFAFTVKNVGGASGPAQITSFDGEEFMNQNGCDGVELPPGGECTIEVAFRAEEVGTFTGQLGVSAQIDGSDEVTASFSGTGTHPVLSASPAELGFGSHEVGTTTAQTVTISNSGTGTAKVESVLLEGPPTSFELPAGGDECTGAELADSDTCTIEVAFNPAAAGPLAATLKVEGDATITPTWVNVGGTGTTPPIPPPPVEPSATLAGPGPFTANAAGAAPVALVCAASGPACQVTLALQAGGAQLGGWSGALAPGAGATAEVPLSAAARKQLGAKGKLSAEAAIGVAGGKGSATAVTLLAPPAPRLAVKSAKRSGNAVLFKLSCRGYATRCQGKLALGPAKGPGTYASGEVALPKGTHDLRLPLSGAGKRALEADPRAQLRAKATATDAIYHRAVTANAKLRLGS